MTGLLWFAAGAATMGGYALALDGWHRYRMWRLARDIQACRWAIRRRRVELERALRDLPSVHPIRQFGRDLTLMDNERWSKAV